MSAMEDFLAAFEMAATMIADALEGERGLKHERHQDHLGPAIASVRTVMRKYFVRQQDALLLEILPHLRSNIAQFQEATRKNGKQLANSILPNSVAPLRFAVSDSEDQAYNAAIASAIEGAAEVVRAEMLVDATLHPNFASNFLRNNSLTKLTGNIADTTKTRLRNAIADAWDAGGSYDQVVGAIKATYKEFGAVRAGMIAQTEVVTAYNAGRKATAEAAGFDEHQWETESGNPCEICLANEAQGWLPIGQAFQSGDMAPAAHPNCECVENFRSS